MDVPCFCASPACIIRGLHNISPSITFNSPFTLSMSVAWTPSSSSSSASFSCFSSLIAFKCSCVVMEVAWSPTGWGSVVFLAVESGSLKPVSWGIGISLISKLTSWNPVGVFYTFITFLFRRLDRHPSMSTICMPRARGSWDDRGLFTDVSGDILFARQSYEASDRHHSRSRL